VCYYLAAYVAYRRSEWAPQEKSLSNGVSCCMKNLAVWVTFVLVLSSIDTGVAVSRAVSVRTRSTPATEAGLSQRRLQARP
jgi:hypothetical protein